MRRIEPTNTHAQSTNDGSSIVGPAIVQTGVVTTVALLATGPVGWAVLGIGAICGVAALSNDN